jgi:hypothetical protein
VTTAALIISVCALVTSAVAAYPGWKLWRIDRAKAKAVREGNICTWCGLPNTAPQEERARPCPRNPKGEVGHHWQVSIGDVGARVSGR